MVCSEYSFSRHAVEKMFNRGISTDEVKQIAQDGDLIREYPEDQPYPSYLLLGYVNGRPLHVLVAQETEGGPCVVVTAYVPDNTYWLDDYRTRRNRE